MAEHAFAEISPAFGRMLPSASKRPVGGQVAPRFDSEVDMAIGAVALDLVAARTVLGSLESRQRVGVDPVSIMGKEIDVLAMMADRAILRFEMADSAVGPGASHIELVLVAVISGVTRRALGKGGEHVLIVTFEADRWFGHQWEVWQTACHRGVTGHTLELRILGMNLVIEDGSH